MLKSKNKHKWKRLKPISNKRREENKTYVPLSKSFIKEHPQCAIRSTVCTGYTQCIHHSKGRGIYLCDVRYFIPSCALCNGYVETNKQWAIERGFRLDRLGI